jgi:hypothetical protein
VYQLLKAHCGNSGCHDGSLGSNPSFNVNLPADSFYKSIINKTPVNPAAAANYNKLVVPGDVQRSFMLRKMAHGIASGLALSQAEGVDMPQSLPKLADNEIELVRQWILYAAPDTGNVVDTAMINTFYRNGGITDTYSPHDAPAAGQGFQVYYGKVFLKPNTETEYFLKYDPHISPAIEAWQVSTMMPAVDHHFGIWMYQPGTDVLYHNGLRPLAEGSMEHVAYGIGTASGLWNYTLPTGTAFFLDQGQKFDLDLHIQNPSPDSILGTDLYANIYTQPLGTATSYMRVNNFVNDQIVIPEDNQPHTFTVTCIDSSQTQYWKLWKMYTHTHKYGTAFNVWLRNPDGSKGAMVYNGNYSYEDGYDVGYYRWGPHVTFRTWPGDSLFEVDPRLGFIGEATFKNTAGPDPTIWGFSSADEMMAVGFYYVNGNDLPTAVIEPKAEQQSVRVFPNPVLDQFVVSYELAEAQSVHIDLYDVMGNKVGTLLNTSPQTKGKYTHSFNTADYNMAPGIYLVSFNVGGVVTTEKLIVSE